MAGRTDEHSNRKYMIVGSVLVGLLVLFVDGVAGVVRWVFGR